MKRTYLSLVCIFLISACSMSVEEIFLIPTKTLTPTLTSTITPTNIPTFTATIVTPTFSLTPTLAGQRTPTLTLEPTLTVKPSETPVPPTLTSTVAMQGFVTVFTSRADFFKAGICEPTSVKFTAQAANAAGTAFVVLFVRFKSRQTGATSEWTSITMQRLNPGTFVHDLVASEMKGVDSFPNAWVQYQLVATDSKTNEIGRTAIFDERLSVLNCVPTPTLSAIPATSTP
jgi:hypothetical protein